MENWASLVDANSLENCTAFTGSRGSNPSWFNSYPTGIATSIVVVKHLYDVIITLQSLVLG